VALHLLLRLAVSSLRRPPTVQQVASNQDFNPLLLFGNHNLHHSIGLAR